MFSLLSHRISSLLRTAAVMRVSTSSESISDSNVWKNFETSPDLGVTVRTTYPENPNGVTVMLECWDEGSVEHPHAHPGDDMTVVVEGKMSIQYYKNDGKTADGKRVVLKKGDIGITSRSCPRKRS